MAFQTVYLVYMLLNCGVPAPFLFIRSDNCLVLLLMDHINLGTFLKQINWNISGKSLGLIQEGFLTLPLHRNGVKMYKKTKLFD